MAFPPDTYTVDTRPRPSILRLALLMLLAIYPLITGLVYMLMPMIEDWSKWQHMLVLAPTMDSSIVFGVAPTIQKFFDWFILPLVDYVGGDSRH